LRFLEVILGITLHIPTVHDFRVVQRAHEPARAQNVRDFVFLPTKLDSEINAPFYQTRTMSQIFFHVFAKNSLIKHILEVEKRFDSGTCECFGQGEDIKPTTKLSEKNGAKSHPTTNDNRLLKHISRR